MKVGLAGDHRAGGAKPLHQPGVLRSIAVAFRDRIARRNVVGAPARSKQSLTETGSPHRRASTIAKQAAGAGRNRFSAVQPRPCPLGVLPKICISAKVPIGVAPVPARPDSEGRIDAVCKRAAQTADRPWGSSSYRDCRRVCAAPAYRRGPKFFARAAARRRANFEYGSCFHLRAACDRASRQTNAAFRAAVDPLSMLPGCPLSWLSPRGLCIRPARDHSAPHRSHEIRRSAAARAERCQAAVRSQRARRGARHPPGDQAPEEALACRLHALHHLRTVPHVHERGAVGRARSRGLRRDHRRCESPLQPDSDFRQRRSPHEAIWPASSTARFCATNVMLYSLTPECCGAFRTWATRKRK